MNQNELMHSGVKGMRWGVRKARPSSGSGGTKSAKKTITPTQKKAARANVQAKARKIRKTHLSEIDRRRNETARRAMEKAENSIFGVGMAKVPGKLEYYHSYRAGTITDGRGRSTKIHGVTHVTAKQIAARTAIGFAALGAVSLAGRV